jgi:hypothetical protein
MALSISPLLVQDSFIEISGGGDEGSGRHMGVDAIGEQARERKKGHREEE